MEFKTRTAKSRIVLPEFFEVSSDYYASKRFADKQEREQVRLERLPELMHDKEFLNVVENTETYKQYGYLSFWSGTIGTKLDGYYRMNPQGRRLNEMFQFISKDRSVAVVNPTLDGLAHFEKGVLPLLVCIGAPLYYGKPLSIRSNNRLEENGNMVLLEQRQLSHIELAAKRV